MHYRALMIVAVVALVTAAPQVVSATPNAGGSAIKTATDGNSNVVTVWYGYRGYHRGYGGYGYRGYGGYGYRGYGGYYGRY